MRRLLGLAALRFYRAHPWQLVLTLAGISLGVAVYVGVDLASDSAQRAFEISASLLRGETTHRLLAVGGELDERVFTELVTTRGIAHAAPVVELEAQLPDLSAARYPMLGVDPVQELAVRSSTGIGPPGGGDVARLIAEPGTALVPEALASELGVERGGTIRVIVNGRETGLEVVGTLRSAPTDTRLNPPIVVDIATAQELARRFGTLSRIDLRLTARQARDLGARLPAGTALVSADEEDRGFEALSNAFATNLRALGLLALVVGLFLIYSTISFTIVQRRATLGVWRALGLTRSEILGSVLSEALALGGVATVAGVLLGHVLATHLVDLVLRTIGDLYFTGAVTAAPPSPAVYLRGLGLGLAGSLLAAARPALEAARTEPASVLRRASLERRTRHGVWLGVALAAVCVAVSLPLLRYGPQDLYAAFAGLFGILAASALLVPAATLGFVRGVDAVGRRLLPLSALLAVRNVGASLSRTGVATAALAIAVASVNGVGLMISSFRTSLDEWLRTTITADLYFALDETGASLPAERLGAIERLAGVRGLSLTRAVSVPTEAGDIALRGVRAGPDGFGLDIVGGDPERALSDLEHGRGTVVSERLAFALDLEVGDAFAVPTPVGVETLPIVGAFRDFNTGGYSAVVSLDWLARYWTDRKLTGIGIHLERGADAARVESAVRDLLAEPVRIRSSETIRRFSLEIFDRTFKITEVLRVLAAVVAFLGVLSALLSIELERARELAVLRAVGFSAREVASNLLSQTALLGFAAGAAAAPIGVVLAALLVHVINRRSFGWSMELVVVPEPLLAGLALALGAALLAGLFPALRVNRESVGTALREE